MGWCRRAARGGGRRVPDDGASTEARAISSGGPPDTLNDRHRLLASYIALGYSREDAAAKCGISKGRVDTIMTSPLMTHEIAQERRRIRERITADALGLLQQEAVPSVRRLVGLRDQDDNRTVALGATNSILDRVIPKTTRLEEDRTLRIVFDAEILTDMREAMIEDGAFVDVEEALGQATASGEQPAPMVSPPPPAVASRTRAGLATLADVLVELELAEALAEAADAEAEPA